MFIYTFMCVKLFELFIFILMGIYRHDLIGTQMLVPFAFPHSLHSPQQSPYSWKGTVA